MSIRIGSVSATKWQAGRRAAITSAPARLPPRLTGMQSRRVRRLAKVPSAFTIKSVLSRRHDVADNGCFTECLAGFQPMQPFHQHVAFAIAADQDGRLLPDLKDALGDLGHGLGLERRTTLHRHVDVGDRKYLALHHGSSPPVAGSDLAAERC